MGVVIVQAQLQQEHPYALDRILVGGRINTFIEVPAQIQPELTGLAQHQILQGQGIADLFRGISGGPELVTLIEGADRRSAAHTDALVIHAAVVILLQKGLQLQCNGVIRGRSNSLIAAVAGVYHESVRVQHPTVKFMGLFIIDIAAIASLMVAGFVEGIMERMGRGV